MATVISTFNNVIGFNNSLKQATWTPLTTTNADGSPFEFVDWADRTIQLTGTFGVGGTLIIEGSNLATPPATSVAAHTLNDPQGNALSFTAAKMEQVLEMPRWIRPRVTGGEAVEIKRVALDPLPGLVPGTFFYITGDDVRYIGEAYE